MTTRTNQPKALNWMARPEPIIGCPNGFEYLKNLDQFQIEQIAKLPEEFSAWEKGSAKAKRYIIKNSNGQLMYYAVQEVSKGCFLSAKSVTINIIDNLNKTIMKIEQEENCCSSLCFSNWFNKCSNRVKIQAPNGKSMGIVRQKSSFLRPYYYVFDEDYKMISRVEGPCCLVNDLICPLDNYFTIMPPERNLNLGKISKQFASTVADINSKTIGHRFGTTIPVDLPVKIKSNILGVVFSLNSIYYE